MPESAQSTDYQADGYAPGYRGWRADLLLLFLVLLNIISFIDRQLLQSFVVDIRRDLDLSYFQFSLLTGFFFSLSYTVAGLFMGALADRFTRPKLISAGLCAWSAMTAASGLAMNFAHLAAARTFVALGEATLSPSALSMIADVFPPKRSGLASGIYYLGIPLGAGGSLLVAGLLGPVIGWRGCFYLLGGIGVVLALAVILLRDPPRRSATDGGQASPLKKALPELIGLLRASAALRYLLIAAMFAIFSQGALVLDQAWLVEERGYGISEAQTIFGLLFLTAGIVGAILGGQLSDYFHTRVKGGRMMFLAIAFLIVAPVSIVYRLIDPGTILFYACAVIGSIAIMLPYGPIVACAAELAPARMRATVIALTVLMMALFGTAAGNAFVGWLSDDLIARGVEAPLTWALIISGSASFLSIPFFYLAGRKYKEGTAVALTQ